MNIEFDSEQEREDFKKLKLIEINGIEYIQRDFVKEMLLKWDEKVKSNSVLGDVMEIALLVIQDNEIKEVCCNNCKHNGGQMIRQGNCDGCVKNGILTRHERSL